MKDKENIWNLYLEGAAEDMMNNILRKNNVPQELYDLFLSTNENNKLIFKSDDVPLLYKWIQNENADTRTLKDDYLTYLKFFGNRKIAEFNNYIQWTEAVHSKRDEASYQSRNKTLKDIDITGEDKEDVLADDEDVLILKGDNENKCVRYGKGYSFCISRPGGGNMYGNYRLSKSSTFYFIFFKKIPKEDTRHIMVLDRTEEGWEWTFGENETKKIKGGWDEVVRNFPMLAKYENIFVNNPLTDEERTYQSLIQSFVKNPNLGLFNQFSYQQKAEVLKYGMLIPLDIFKTLDNYLRNEWVSVGPKMNDDIYELLKNNEIKRFAEVRKQQLQQRDLEDKYDFEISKNDPELYNKRIIPEKQKAEADQKRLNEKMVNNEIHGDVIINSKCFCPNLDNLEFVSGRFYCRGLIVDVNLPKLRYAKYLTVDNVPTLNAPKLITAGTIYAINSKNLNLPLLETAGEIIAQSIRNLDLPQLQKVDSIKTPRVVTVNLPKLETAKGNILLNQVTKIDLPKLEIVFDLYAQSAITLNVPKLGKCRKIFIRKEIKKIIASKSITDNISFDNKNINITPNDIEVIEPSNKEEQLNDSVIYSLMKQFLLTT